MDSQNKTTNSASNSYLKKLEIYSKYSERDLSGEYKQVESITNTYETYAANVIIYKLITLSEPYGLKDLQVIVNDYNNHELYMPDEEKVCLLTVLWTFSKNVNLGDQVIQPLLARLSPEARQEVINSSKTFLTYKKFRECTNAVLNSFNVLVNSIDKTKKFEGSLSVQECLDKNMCDKSRLSEFYYNRLFNLAKTCGIKIDFKKIYSIFVKHGDKPSMITGISKSIFDEANRTTPINIKDVYMFDNIGKDIRIVYESRMKQKMNQEQAK